MILVGAAIKDLLFGSRCPAPYFDFSPLTGRIPTDSIPAVFPKHLEQTLSMKGSHCLGRADSAHLPLPPNGGLLQGRNTGLFILVSSSGRMWGWHGLGAPRRMNERHMHCIGAIELICIQNVCQTIRDRWCCHR